MNVLWSRALEPQVVRHELHQAADDHGRGSAASAHLAVENEDGLISCLRGTIQDDVKHLRDGSLLIGSVQWARTLLRKTKKKKKRARAKRSLHWNAKKVYSPVALTLKDLKGSVDVLGRQVLPIGLSRRSFLEKVNTIIFDSKHKPLVGRSGRLHRGGERFHCFEWSPQLDRPSFEPPWAPPSRGWCQWSRCWGEALWGFSAQTAFPWYTAQALPSCSSTRSSCGLRQFCQARDWLLAVWKIMLKLIKITQIK